MKANQKGFGATKALVVFLVVGVLCVAGWYVWKSYSTKTTTSSKGAAQIPATEIPSGWTDYDNKVLGISFAYPKTWTFEDKSKAALYGQHYIGDLTSDDNVTSAGIKLTRKQDDQIVYSTLEEWKAYAQKTNIKYTTLVAVKSGYAAFKYTLDAGDATSLVYKVFSPTKNAEIVVLPADTSSKNIIEQIVTTLRLEP